MVRPLKILICSGIICLIVRARAKADVGVSTSAGRLQTFGGLPSQGLRKARFRDQTLPDALGYSKLRRPLVAEGRGCSQVSQRLRKSAHPPTRETLSRIDLFRSRRRPQCVSKILNSSPLAVAVAGSQNEGRGGNGALRG